ncbi:hypothetical protein [Vibrio barjaei]|uniref:hypothetical protein n=1 Tax=Vibrio barjaei TaxID=1676683 RepID=UPI0022832F0C|nr:hypothetical protein [Vibrio barjaei]MCY9872383.1 hypothetical protein [Vibrio barjaei]
MKFARICKVENTNAQALVMVFRNKGESKPTIKVAASFGDGVLYCTSLSSNEKVLSDEELFDLIHTEEFESNVKNIVMSQSISSKLGQPIDEDFCFIYDAHDKFDHVVFVNDKDSEHFVSMYVKNERFECEKVVLEDVSLKELQGYTQVQIHGVIDMAMYSLPGYSDPVSQSLLGSSNFTVLQ